MIIQSEWLEDNTPYKPKDIDLVIDKIWYNCTFTYNNKLKYLNIPVSFDTETTSFYDKNNNKTAIVYVWMLGICGLVVMGRTWDEWLYVYNRLVSRFRLNENRVIIIYVHNLSFDFQFIRKHHDFIKVFATDKYMPLYARTKEGIEFRCSYRLSGYNLETLGKNLIYHKIQKLKGDLDYRELRHTKTPLSDKEKMYCINDAKIVCAYIDELIERENGIDNIPLTKTGFVRRYCRNECFKDKNYKYMIHDLQLTADEFLLCKSAFQGGFTHSNPEQTRKALYNVTSLDIVSSYPSVLVSEKYPMSTPKHVEIKSYKEFKYYLSNYCCVFSIQLNQIKPRKYFDFYISSSKCTIYGKRIISNGRLVSADSIITTITNVDYDIIEYMYTFDKNNICIGDFIYFDRDYLPTAFIKALLNTYQKKTELKGVKGMETEYLVMKENLNSFYGMTVTSPIRDTYIYDNEWHDGQPPESIEQAMKTYNNSYSRFLYYPWGIFVTAYARHSVFEAIIECGNGIDENGESDYIYCDTDSVKTLNFSTHADFFKRYNANVLHKHESACKSHGIDISLCKPKNKKGETKILGTFENEGTYDIFKTLGAKRYLYKIGDNYGLVVAGLNKQTGLKYMQQTYDKYIFDAFDDGIIVPSEYSGRLIHTYIDEIREGNIIDKYGVTAHYCELSAVHLEPATYTLGIIQNFKNIIKSIKEGDYPWEL